MNMTEADNNFWDKVAAISRLDLHSGNKFTLQMALNIQGQVAQSRKNKPFADWTIEDLVEVFVRKNYLQDSYGNFNGELHQ